jgi:hypothetical protein
LAIIEPTTIRAGPVAQGGKDAKMGEKKREMKKRKAVKMEVRPVRPPSVIPAPDSM